MIKIFNMNDVDWVAAESVEDAVKVMKSITDYDLEEESPVELSDKEMQSHTFYDEMDNDKSEKRSFREQLDIMIKSGTQFPVFFASSEY